jgi:MoaA/NifB/PqqE/SkfB family radical SAM enzyme
MTQLDGLAGFGDRPTGALRDAVDGGLNFLWLELTNRCNLQCVHCYTESHPLSGDRDVLTTAAYESVMRQAYALGCRRLQFIGGEPQLHPDFLRLLGAAKETGYEFIEVFTNLTRLRDDTLRFAAEAGIRFATSVYSDDPAVHNAITKVGSSHTRTIGNLRRLIDHGVGTRAAIIRIDQPPEAVERTKHFLRGLGVPSVRVGEVRAFGRGQALLDQPAVPDGLCGHCWAGKLCVAPDGDAYLCVMARQWPVGNVLEAPLAEIVRGKPLADIRQMIYQTVWAPKAAGERGPSPHDGPDEPPEPDGRYEDAPPPASDPGGCSPECTPGSCPQSCVPDSIPPGCPQSCEPFIVSCEPGPEEPADHGGSVGCDVIEDCGPDVCPQSCGPTAPPCEQSGCDPLIDVIVEGPGCPQSPA